MSVYHRAWKVVSVDAARPIVPDYVRLHGDRLLDAVGDEMECGAGVMVEAEEPGHFWWIETHTVGCQEFSAADEPEENWWRYHRIMHDNLAADPNTVVVGDPDGVFVSYTWQEGDAVPDARRFLAGVPGDYTRGEQGQVRPEQTLSAGIW